MNSKIHQRFSQIATEKAIPMQASLELTYRCNERCTHCYIEDFNDDPKRVLNQDEWFKVLKELRSAGTLYLILMGGEPLISKHFFPIAEKATELGFHVSMISNGIKIRTLEHARKLKDAGIKLVTFSLYSLDPKIHDTITQVRHSHKMLMRAIDFCDQVGLEISINSLLTEANARGMFELYEWAQSRAFELKVDPNITSKLNGDKAPTMFRASRETLKWFFQERTRRWESSRPSPALETANDYICNAAKGKCAVNPYGELLPCIEIREPFGSLVESSFEELWQSPTALKWRTPKLRDMTDMGSDGLYGFCDHCPGMAKNETGKPFEVMPYTKLVAEVKKEVAEQANEPDSGINELSI